MNHLSSGKSTHPVTFAIRSFIDKLMQHPGVYPIKYYKKTAKLRKKRATMTGF
ncbi:MAG: hypothetical protein QM687_02080 [Ferruginibacter sp.]